MHNVYILFEYKFILCFRAMSLAMCLEMIFVYEILFPFYLGISPLHFYVNLFVFKLFQMLLFCGWRSHYLQQTYCDDEKRKI